MFKDVGNIDKQFRYNLYCYVKGGNTLLWLLRVSYRAIFKMGRVAMVTTGNQLISLGKHSIHR